MANIIVDNNRVKVIAGVLNTDGTTITLIKATNNILNVSNGTDGSDFGQTRSPRDANNKTVLMAVSETDGTTPVPLYVDSNGNLLIDST